MPKLLAKRRVRVTVHIDSELYAFFSALRYSPIEDRFKYGFSDKVNELLYAEQARIQAAGRAEPGAAS